MCTNITYYDIILNNSNNTKYRNNVWYSTTMTDIYDMHHVHFPFTTDQSLKFWVCVSRKTASSLKMSPDFLFSFVHYLFMSWHVNVGQWLLKGDQHKVCELWTLICMYAEVVLLSVLLQKHAWWFHYASKEEGGWGRTSSDCHTTAR